MHVFQLVAPAQAGAYLRLALYRTARRDATAQSGTGRGKARAYLGPCLRRDDGYRDLLVALESRQCLAGVGKGLRDIDRGVLRGFGRGACAVGGRIVGGWFKLFRGGQRRNLLADRWITESFSPSASDSPEDPNASLIPSMAFNGVRTSWLMLATRSRRWRSASLAFESASFTSFTR